MPRYIAEGHGRPPTNTGFPLSYTSHYSETAPSVTGTRQTGPGVAGSGQTGAGEALWQVAAGLQGGAGMREFRAGIEAGQHALGNRAFMHWVGELQSTGQDAAAQGMAVPLQMMPKKKKKQGVVQDEAGPEARAEPVHPAAGTQGVTMVAEIAPVKSDFSRRDAELFGACIKGDPGRFRQFIRFGKVDVNMSDKLGTLLCHAAYGGCTAITRELLSMPGIDVNLAQHKGATPLYLAAQWRHVKVVELLLAARGINVNLATTEAATPLHVAAQKGHVEIVGLLLAAHGINVNPELPEKNITPLHFALHLGHEKVAGLLLDAPGIEVDKPLKSGIAPIHYAARNNLPGIVEQLVRRGADANLALPSGITPLYYAADKGHLEVVRTLLQTPGIRVNQATGIRYLPLGIAAQRAHKDIVRLLLRKGADPNIKTATGLTPLHVACLFGHMAIVQMLLYFGADTDAEVKDPEAKRPIQTPYSLAGLGGHRGVMSVLTAYRRHNEAAARVEQLSVTEEPGRTAQTLASPEAVSLPVIAADTPVKHTTSTSPEAPESQAMEKQDASGEAISRAATASVTPDRPDKTGTGTQAAARTPLAQAKDGLRQEVLVKLRADNLEPLEGIRLLEDVNAADSLVALCSLYNRLAHIERHKERARRAGKRREEASLTVVPGPASAVAPVYTLEESTGLDAERVEGEIKKHLDQRYHRFISQTVNDMEFGRGKPTTGHAELWHVSAGIIGVGSCSVFYYLEGSAAKIRIVGIGHHVAGAAYRLDYTAQPLADCRLLQLMGKKKQQQAPPGRPGDAGKTEDAGKTGGAGAGAKEGAQPEAGATLPGPEQTLSGKGSAQETEPGQKKKKKSRVQLALNTLRGEGMAAFGAYIEAEIGEAAVLHTLVERITRAQDLGGVRKEALEVVEGRLRLLDPLLPQGQVPLLPASAGTSFAGQAPLLTTAGAGREEPEIAPVKARLNRRERELFDACARGNVGKFRLLLRNVKVDINVADDFGTLLVNAAFDGREYIVRDLLSVQGINVNLAQQQGATPLYLAAQEGHVKIVEMLLAARGIKINLSKWDGATPLFVAAQNGHVETVELLLAAPGVKVNLKTSADGGTPVLVAIQGGHAEVAKRLLAAPGIDIDARTEDGATALYIAAEHNFPGIVEELARRGANVNLALDSGETPLGIGAYQGNAGVVRKLLQAPGIEVDKPSEDGLTPLAVAADGGYGDIVRWLLKHGADPNRGTPDGITALHRACLYGHTGIVEMLLHAGANTDTEVNDPEVIHRTPYDLAQLVGHRSVMRLLENHRKAGAQQASPPVTTPAGAAEAASLTSPAVGESRDREGSQPPGNRATASPSVSQSAAPPTPLAQAQDGLRQQVLGKLRDNNLDPRDGILLLQDVNAANDLDGLCNVHNKLARLERRQVRARRRRRRRGLSRGREAAPGRVAATAPVFTLGGKTGLDAERVEIEIKSHLGQKYRRFVSQAVNDMEFGRGKGTTGYPGLLHASAGIPDVGSCSVFYYLDAERNRIRIVGIGHHVGRAAYRLGYAAEELGEAGRILRIA